MRTILGLSRAYLLPEEFIKHKKEFNTNKLDFFKNEKNRIRKSLLNVPAVPRSYNPVSTIRASIRAVKKARFDIERLIDYSRNHRSKKILKSGRNSPAADINEVHSEQQSETQSIVECLEDIIFIFQEHYNKTMKVLYIVQY